MVLGGVKYSLGRFVGLGYDCIGAGDDEYDYALEIHGSCSSIALACCGKVYSVSRCDGLGGNQIVLQ